MKALVTGGTGFIGSHVVRKLVSEHVPVRCLVRNSSPRANLSGLEVEFMVGDLADPESLKRALEGCDTLFHVAADYRLWAPHPEELERINVQGTRELLRAAADAGIKRIVYTSSVAAVGRPPSPGLRPPSPLSRERDITGQNSNSPLHTQGRGEGGEGGIGREELDPTPAQLVGPYKRSKFYSDKLVREMAREGLPVVLVNPSAPIGSHDIKPTPTGKMIVDFLNGKMPAYVDTGMNFIDVEDVAAGHWLAYQKGQAGERYILGHQNITLKEFLDLVARVSGRPAPRIRIPYAVAYLAGAVSTGLSYITRKEPAIPLDGVRMAHAPMYYDASKAVRELGLPQTPIEEAIRKAVSWFKANGYVRH